MNDTKLPEYIEETSIPGLLVIKRPVFTDERGFFHEVFRLNQLSILGLDFKIVQISHSYSLPRVIRAIHTEGWNKLVYPTTGKTFTAIVDVRPDSPTFGKHQEFIFDNTIPNSTYSALFIPKGLGNSICVIGDTPVDYIYAVDEYWSAEKAQGIAWDDPDIGIKWPITEPIISERDKHNPRLRDLFPEKFANK